MTWPEDCRLIVGKFRESRSSTPTCRTDRPSVRKSSTTNCGGSNGTASSSQSDSPVETRRCGWATSTSRQPRRRFRAQKHEGKVGFHPLEKERSAASQLGDGSICSESSTRGRGTTPSGSSSSPRRLSGTSDGASTTFTRLRGLPKGAFLARSTASPGDGNARLTTPSSSLSSTFRPSRGTVVG